MRKVINDAKISFYDENDIEIMFMDYSTDECIWFFNSSDVITITNDMDLFEPLKNIMLQQYEFSNNEVLKSYKDTNSLLWYSDCYYNPSDEWSKNSVSYLKIEYVDNIFKIKCTKPLDNMIDRKSKSHIITFSPMGNGKYAKNINSSLTLQDDFVIMVYKKLKELEKTKKLNKK